MNAIEQEELDKLRSQPIHQTAHPDGLVTCRTCDGAGLVDPYPKRIETGPVSGPGIWAIAREYAIARKVAKYGTQEYPKADTMHEELES